MAIPFPKVLDDDLDDVAEFLMMGAARWAGGEHAEAMEYLRRAMQSAQEGDQEDRWLQLAKLKSAIAEELSEARSRAGAPAPKQKDPSRAGVSQTGKHAALTKSGQHRQAKIPQPEPARAAAVVPRASAFPKPGVGPGPTTGAAPGSPGLRPSSLPKIGTPGSAMGPLPPLRPLSNSSPPAPADTRGAWAAAEDDEEEEATSQIDLARDAVEVIDTDDRGASRTYQKVGAAPKPGSKKEEPRPVRTPAPFEARRDEPKRPSAGDSASAAREPARAAVLPSTVPRSPFQPPAAPAPQVGKAVAPAARVEPSKAPTTREPAKVKESRADRGRSPESFDRGRSPEPLDRGRSPGSFDARNQAPAPPAPALNNLVDEDEDMPTHTDAMEVMRLERQQHALRAPAPAPASVPPPARKPEAQAAPIERTRKEAPTELAQQPAAQRQVHEQAIDKLATSPAIVGALRVRLRREGDRVIATLDVGQASQEGSAIVVPLTADLKGLFGLP